MLLEIPLQFAICKELAFKFQYKHPLTDVLADFWHRTANLYAVKNVGVVTSEIKRKLRQRNGRTEQNRTEPSQKRTFSLLPTGLYFISCYGS